jgi:ABC-type dipeptide/oligopeptide/nickel transport system permease subunit
LAVTALPVFGAVGAITVVGTVVGSVVGAAAGVADELMEEKKK